MEAKMQTELCTVLMDRVMSITAISIDRDDEPYGKKIWSGEFRRNQRSAH